ncbi:MAG: Cys-tRNA(Pro) deacylase [Pseudomonadota bacterium]
MTPAINAAKKARITHVVHRYEHDPRADSYGLEAARALGQEPARVFKTLVADVDARELVVAILPVETRLDLKALANACHAKKATMADPAKAERATGYVVGGISPLGQKRRLLTVIDTSASAYETIYVSAGRRGLEIELAPDDLATLTAATFAPLARGE